MQNQLNYVGDTLLHLNEGDMKEKRAELKDILHHGRYDHETPIPAEGDRQHNNSLQSQA